MFHTKNRRIVLDRIYINEHTLEQHSDRKTKKAVDFTLPKEIVIVLMPQRSKDRNSISMNKLRGAIQLKNNLFLIVNIYEDPKTNELLAKGLTILTKKQLNKGSHNFPGGNYLKQGFITATPPLEKRDIYFDDRIYTDFLDTVTWDEYDVQYI